MDAAVTDPSTSRHRVVRLASLLCNEMAVFFAGAGVIAAHVLDDSFVRPEPGTAGGDHVLSGLITLTVLVLAAVAYPRLRAGLVR